MLDYEDNTPLHSACEHEACDAITFLIENGADTSVLNKNVQSPLHLSTQLNKVKSLQAATSPLQEKTPTGTCYAKAL
ncbi:hypothetical protein V5799_005036 [Amblyomma americanum]|uniref:Uncharacterized protein n=1 Tax=Amblyomma americanum TaxID=6943 RepID=A0AAQ4D4E2_AMBAM